MGHIIGIDQVQVPMPVGAEELARFKETVSDHLRATIHDPFGNRVELIAQ